MPSHKESIEISKEVSPVLEQLRKRIEFLLEQAQSPDKQQIEHTTTVLRWKRLQELIMDLEEELDECEEHF